MKAKSFIASWTLWFNFIMIFGSWIHDHVPALLAQFPDGAFHTWINYVIVAGNFILRFKTIGPIALSFAKNAGKWGTPILLAALLGLGARTANASNERVFVKPLLLMDAKGHLTQAEFVAYPKMHEAFLITRERVVLVRQSGENAFQSILDKLGCTMLFALKAHGQITGAVITQVMHIWDDLKKGLSVDGDAFAGLKGKELAPATGLLLMGTWTPPKWGNFFIQAGAGLQLAQSRPVDMVFAAGAGYRTKY